MRQNHYFQVPSSFDAITLSQNIQASFKTSAEPFKTTEERYYDTFDWRLARCNLNLYWQENTLFLADLLDKKTQPISIPWPAHKQLKGIETLTEGPIFERLQSIIEMRALLCLANPFITEQHINILNRDKKITVRLQLKTFHRDNSATDPLVTTLQMKPVRGYLGEAKAFSLFCIDSGLPPTDEISHLKSIYKAFGHKPCAYSTKLKLTFSPNQPAYKTAISIFQSQLSIMQQNEQGIQEDLDTEFLHDFRVALRRSRAGMSEIKGVFSQDITRRFKADLKKIGTMTNRLRDLDVYLLKKDYYKSLLPEQLQPELEDLFKLLGNERNKEKQKVIRAIQSTSYRETISAWGTFLASFQPKGVEAGPNAQYPTKELAQKFIFKAWKKVLTDGRAITPESPDELLHILRLRCKKLRYLLEFFTSLFPKKEMKHLTKQLKNLQENLGDFNDLFVQQETLHEYLDNQVQAYNSPINTAAAIGGLIANLNRKQQEVRNIFTSTFKQFDQQKNQELFRNLFKSETQGSSRI